MVGERSKKIGSNLDKDKTVMFVKTCCLISLIKKYQYLITYLCLTLNNRSQKFSSSSNGKNNIINILKEFLQKCNLFQTRVSVDVLTAGYKGR